MAPVASHLIYLTMGSMADYLFGAGDAHRARRRLQRLFQVPSNVFSYQFANVALSAGDVVGLLIAYPVRAVNRLALPTALQYIRTAGLREFIRFMFRIRRLINIKEAEDDEYFIAHLAVLPARQGQGVGRLLLAHAGQLAGSQGFNKLALTVEVDNQRARDLYLRAGFRVVDTVQIESLRRTIGYPGFYRMRKLLD